MTNYETKIYNKLESMFIASDWKPITITMKETGVEITCVPLFAGEENSPKYMDHCTYITTKGEEDACMYGSTPVQMVKNLANHKEIRAQYEQDKERKRRNDNWRTMAASYNIF